MSKTPTPVTHSAPAKDEALVVVDVAHAPVNHLSQARALPEHTGKPGRLVTEGIQAFKDTDFRTMAIAVHGGVLVKQAVSR